jgi:two-component system, response regulator
MYADRPHEVLYVEDRPEDAELVQRIFATLDTPSRIHHSRDGVEAIAFVDAQAGATLDLILLDLKIPRLDGHEVLRVLKETEQTRHVPIVVLTSSRESSDVARAYALGANSYVVKPVSFDELRDVVRGLGDYWLRVNLPVP